MTIREFFTALEQEVPRGRWFPFPGGAIRARHPATVYLLCPITALAYHRLGLCFYLGDFDNAAEALGIEPATTRVIVRAADVLPRYDRAYRIDLLRACGLSE